MKLGKKTLLFNSTIQRRNNLIRARIFESRLHLYRRLTLPTLNSLHSTSSPWPNATTPSDHIPLIVDFILSI